jgi:K+-sensing histidine kinase KdpD
VTSSTPTRVLVVANRTAATPRLIRAVRERAQRGPCNFTLLVPRPTWDPETGEAEMTIELAIPLLREAAGADVKAHVGESDPEEAVERLLEREQFDEIILSTLPERVSRWLRRDIPHKLERFGLPITVITAPQAHVSA